MQVVIISKEQNGEKEAIGASASKAQAEKYIREQELKNCNLEIIDLPANNKERLDSLYLAFKPQDGDQNTILVGYFTNRFKAQQASQPGGHISRIPLLENRPKSTTRPPTQPPQEIPSGEPENKRKSNPTKTQKVNREANTQNNKTRILFGLIVLWILAIVVMFSLSPSSNYEWGENKETVEFLPNYCRDISYYISERFKVYEFPCDETLFKRFAFEQKFIYKEIENPSRAKTYRQYAEVDWKAPDGLSDAEQWALWKNLSQPTVKDGAYIYAKMGFVGDVYGLFDRTAGRLYYWEKAVAAR